MSEKSDKELQGIVDNKDYVQEDTYLAAITELEKRGMPTIEISNNKEDNLESRSKEQHEEHDTNEEKKIEKKKTIKETIGLLKPTKDYVFTPVIVYLNILIFVLMVLNGVHPIMPTVESLITWGGNLRGITLDGQQWRLLTSVFLHGGLLHLLFNMYALLYIGGLLETKFGKTRYLFAYIITGLFASIASISFYDNIVSVGASGAIFGMYGLFLALLTLKGLNIPKESRKNLITSILFFIGYNLFYGFAKEGIDNAAHIGGLISGFIIGFAFYPSFKEPKYSKPISFGIAIILLITVLIIPKVVSNKFGEFNAAMAEFSKNEEKALWMNNEDLSFIPEEKIQYYYDKLKNESIDLWEANLELLDSLSDLPPDLQEKVDVLSDYCRLRIESCKTMQQLLLHERQSDLEELEQINVKIETKLKELEALYE